MYIIGLMSGTSVDGIDAALCEITETDGVLKCDLLHFICYSWTQPLRQEILAICSEKAPLQKVTALNFLLGEWFAKAALSLCQTAQFPINKVDAIASHGQTIWHQPIPIEIAEHEAIGTMQIGEAAVIAARTGCTVISDFRAADMAMGGQGAPLVPYADYILFSHKEEVRAFLNIGGIANITYLPANGTLNDVLAFDTGPGNMLLDGLVSIITKGKKSYDLNGEMALRGKVDYKVVETCLRHRYFARTPPKSTGREDFGTQFIEVFYYLVKERNLSKYDILATATYFTAESIYRAYRDFIQPRPSLNTLILGGGGTRNATLCGHLEQKFAPSKVTTASEFGVNDDAKEAIAFAMFGYNTLKSKPSNVPSATGASCRMILGKITPALPMKLA